MDIAKSLSSPMTASCNADSQVLTDCRLGRQLLSVIHDIDSDAVTISGTDAIDQKAEGTDGLALLANDFADIFLEAMDLQNSQINLLNKSESDLSGFVHKCLDNVFDKSLDSLGGFLDFLWQIAEIAEYRKLLRIL